MTVLRKALIQEWFPVALDLPRFHGRLVLGVDGV